MTSIRYDAVTGELIRVSTNTAGIGGNADNRNATIAQVGARFILPRPITSIRRSPKTAK